jgi:MFS family permease
MLSTLAVAAHADYRKEKTAHVGVPYVLGAVALACFGPAARAAPAAGFVVLCLAMAAAYGGQSTMCARVAGLSPPARAAVTLALFNSICASLGGFAGPVIVGAILKALQSFELAAVVLGLCMGVAGVIMLCVFAWERRRAAQAGASCSCGGCGGCGCGCCGSPPLPGCGNGVAPTVATPTFWDCIP